MCSTSDWVKSPLRLVLGLPQPNLPSGGLSWTILADFCFSCRLVWWKTMSSGVDLPAVDQAGATPAATDPLPGTFLGLELDLKSDKLYDLGGAIPDVMGLQAIQPRVAIVKVMSVPVSRCVRVVVPHGAGAAVVMPGDVVYGLERYILGLCRSHEKSS